MHLLILLGIVADGVFTAGLPQYQPPSSLQPHYKTPPAYDPRPAQDPMYTYAEVNTPYYQYHFYSPVYKNYQHQRPLLDAFPPETSVRNEVNVYAHGISTTLKNLFYPATTKSPFNSPESGLVNRGYTPGYESSMQPFSPTFENRPEVHITSKPLTVNNEFAPVLRTYQAPVLNQIYPSRVTPIFTPIESATGFPNILRESFGNDKNPAETLLTYNSSTLNPDLIVSSTANPIIRLKPIVVPESLANPSSTIIKDEVRRGISPPLVFGDQFSSSKQSSLEKSPLNVDPLTSTSSPKTSVLLESPSEPSVSDTGRISATILRVFSSPNLELTQNYAFNTSVSVPPQADINNVFNVSNISEPFIESTPQVSTQMPTETTASHRQKIAKKANTTTVPKKFLHKHPNVLFYSPGHDTPK